MKETLGTFCKWLNVTRFPIEPWTNEKTIQNQLGLFLNYWLPRTALVELEVNVTRLPGLAGPFRKKEADIIITEGGVRSVIEVKYWRDQGTYNIGMFRCYEDVCFVEQLKHAGFNTSAVLFLTDIQDHYKRFEKVPKPKNNENSILHQSFRCDQQLSGQVQIKTGQLDDTVSITGTYPLQWAKLRDDTWYSIIEI